MQVAVGGHGSIPLDSFFSKKKTRLQRTAETEKNTVSVRDLRCLRLRLRLPGDGELSSSGGLLLLVGDGRIWWPESQTLLPRRSTAFFFPRANTVAGLAAPGRLLGWGRGWPGLYRGRPHGWGRASSGHERSYA
jgi:hypothetical protein